ncbi:MAG: hypothetical protein RhofKO_39550 [Rhodothermales bacterium]
MPPQLTPLSLNPNPYNAMPQPHTPAGGPHVRVLPGALSKNALFMEDEALELVDLLAAVGFILSSTADGPSISSEALRGAATMTHHVRTRIEAYLDAAHNNNLAITQPTRVAA